MDLYPDRTRRYEVKPPPWVAPAIGAGLSLFLAIGFCVLAASALTNRTPIWDPLVSLPIWKAPAVRTLLALIALGNGLIAVHLAAALGSRAVSRLAHRLGWIRVYESEGPCRLINEESGLWGLELELVEGDDPGATSSPTTTRLGSDPTTCNLFFRLDEAAAGAVSRLFDPDEDLRLRWLDLPLSAGGPTLLEIRSGALEATVHLGFEDESLKAA